MNAILMCSQALRLRQGRREANPDYHEWKVRVRLEKQADGKWKVVADINNADS
jgi:ketosteroid isomerase-like protein